MSKLTAEHNKGRFSSLYRRMQALGLHHVGTITA